MGRPFALQYDHNVQGRIYYPTSANSRRYTSPNRGARSSEIIPGPAAAAASPWIHTAAAAASKAGIPWARRPVISPASTSPVPAVASQGGALALTAARPSGAAMTVSAPLCTTTAPAMPAAVLVAESFDSRAAGLF